MKKALSVSCATLLMVFLNTAKAEPVAFEFAGHVTQVPLDEIFGDIQSGDMMQGSVSFDTSAIDLVPADPTTGSYNFSAPFGMTVTIGSHDFAATGSLNIGILNSFIDQFTVLATSSSGDLTLELLLQDNSGSAFNTDQLPSTLPLLTDFTQTDFHLDAVSALGEAQVDGQLDAPETAVIPEPSVFTLVLAGSAALLTSGRSKNLFK